MKKISFILLIFIPSFLRAQEQDPQKMAIIEQRIELIAEALGNENPDFTTLIDELSFYYDHPINLNRTSREELQEIMLLSEVQITALLLHIEKNGKLISIYELQAIPGFDLQTIRNILPFVRVSDMFDAPHIDLHTLLKDGTQEWFVRASQVLEEQQGFTPISDSALAASPNSRYQGTPYRLYTRYRYRFGNSISFGITGDKDAGENFFSGAQKQGFDFYSAHLFVKNIGNVKAAVVGDYQVSFGQGLTFATGLALGKNAYTLNVKRNSQTLRPYTATGENQFMRGAAITYKIKQTEITALYSRDHLDGNRILNSDTTVSGDDEYISSLQTSGLHTTPAEIEDRNAVLVQHMGGHFAWKTKRSNIGFTGIYSTLNPGLQKTTSITNQFDFNGDHNLVTGIDYNYIKNNFNFFGEMSRSLNGGWAMQHGLLASLDPKFSVSVVYRNYQKNYQSLFANALAEASKPVNEKGLYIGLELRPNPNWTINAYFDTFESEWLRSGATGPQRGMEYLAQLQWKPSKTMDMYIRARHRSKPYDDPNDPEEINVLLDKEQNNYRYQFNCKINDQISVRNRIEMMNVGFFERDKQRGYLIYQDLIWKPEKLPITFTGRYAIFDTDSYDARIYAYENDVLYFFSIPSYYYRGTRFYGIIRYQYKKRFDVWLRYGQWLYNNQNTIGSGLSEIQGNRKSEIRIQLRLRF
ncbi:MAG: helix-hairpin-helix domain-containing protein [Flavobacteriales bacterium]|nr:helix-hairpin-helix domain-containing protein [Flavobacteriales bacterium]